MSDAGRLPAPSLCVSVGRVTDDALLRDTILALTAARGPEKSICPSEVARQVSPDDGWQRLMAPVRRVAIGLAEAGTIEILRKGRPVAPDAVRGVIRLRQKRPADTGDA